MEIDERWEAEEILVQKEIAMSRLILAAAAAALMLGSVSFAIAEDQDKSAASPGHQMQEHGSKMGRASPIGSDRNGQIAGVRDREDKQFRKNLNDKVTVDRDRDHRTLRNRGDRFLLGDSDAALRKKKIIVNRDVDRDATFTKKKTIVRDEGDRTLRNRGDHFVLRDSDATFRKKKFIINRDVDRDATFTKKKTIIDREVDRDATFTKKKTIVRDEGNRSVTRDRDGGDFRVGHSASRERQDSHSGRHLLLQDRDDRRR
jgi:hypothetical protein